MSVGNLKDYGNKGNNFPYQLAVLKLLEGINNSISALPGVDYETRTTTYQATVGGPGYSIGDIIVRYDIIDVATSTIISTVWFNQTTQSTIATPTPANITPVIGATSVTVINGAGGAAVNIQDGGNSITIDSSFLDVALSTRNAEATQLLIQTLLTTIDGDTSNLDVLLSTRASETTLTSVLTALGGLATEATLATRLSESDFDTKTGSLTETAPATDTASSGLNGRLQRIAQRITSMITALGSPFQAGGSIGNTTFGITNWLGSTAPTVGQKTMTSSIPVVISSDQSVITTGTETAVTGTPTIVVGAIADTTLLASNTSRKGATIYNDSTGTLRLLLGSAVSSSTVYTVQLQPGGYYEVPYSYTGVIKGNWVIANGNARVTELT